MSEKHTDEAMRAMIKVIQSLHLLVPSGDINAPKGTMAIQGTETTLEDIATITDHETGLPEITAERDRLREALEDCEHIMNISANQLCTPVDSTGQTALNKQLVECVIRTCTALARSENDKD